jgi:acyl carrier protein
VTGDRADVVYRTGDLARRRDDGVFELVGRLDTQVKIRGVRIEPQEVEAAILACEGVLQAAVVDRNDTTGTRMLCAYVVLEPGTSVRTVRERVQTRLPDYMAPSLYVPIDSVPRTATGKVDRAALPAPEEGAPDRANAEAPSSPVEEMLAGLWSEVLSVSRVGATDDFFELGGHSLTVMVLVNRINATFGIDLPIRAVFEVRTLASMAAEVERTIRDGILAMPDSEAERLLSAVHSSASS